MLSRHQPSRAWAAACCLLLGLPALARAQDQPRTQPAPDKSAYTLFNPTPPDLLRDFSPDRPDVTESPYTVDAGHVQIELSFLEYTYNYKDGGRSDAYSVLPTMFKLGLLNDLDVEFAVQPYVNRRERTGSTGAVAKASGFGDQTLLRVKWNLWGNDGGNTAFGLLPFLKFPTGTDGLSNGKVEGGLALPLSVELPWGFELGAMAEFDFVRNVANDGYGMDFLQTVTLQHKIVGGLSGYVEYVGTVGAGVGLGYRPVASFGLLYLLQRNAQLDVGARLGLSHAADQVFVFAGLSLRY